ncbi:MAG TPA: cbb3-type cytochrome c oxidase subunit 3 [Psychromonas hadalis]|nr:cbb3-type cytochrome c oxidase subunit 3 [Psychromonas hadalis]
MENGVVNGLYTLFLIIIFVAMFLWIYSKRQKKSFEDIGSSIFSEEQLSNMPTTKKNIRR